MAGVLTVIALVLIINFKTPDQIAAESGTGAVGIVEPRPSGSSGASGATATPVPASGSTAPEPSTPSGTPAPAATATVAGPVIATRFGPVQVEVVVDAGTIVDVNPLQLPSGGRSGRISSVAFPILQEEALTAQSADVDTVSGATYTSLAYEQSLQAALDGAGI